jgi:chemotaxis protein histidine kinase CheA
LTLELDKLKEIGEQADKMYEKQIQDIETVINTQKEAIQAEKDGYTEIAEVMKSRHEQERTELDSKLRAIKEIYDAELNSIQELTPAQERLQEIRKKELEDRANNASLSEKERVSAQAQLDTMAQQAKAAEVRKAKEEAVKKIEQEKLALAEKQKVEKEELKKKHEEEIAVLQQGLKDQQEELKVIKEERKDIADKVKEIVENEGQVKVEVENVSVALQNQFGVVDTLAQKYSRLADQAERFAAAASQGGGGGGQQNRFAGGSVTGGTPYTVNEFGQEAFLSAAGKLSMINAPSWGTWRAPGAGTVIPAHLTQQLSIPSGGVQVNGGAAAQTSRAASGSSGLLKALRGLGGGNGDRVTNNVTIQAANTTQAASDMMVQLNKIRRRRYS